MGQTVVGLFDDRDRAQGAVKDFLKSDFAADRVSIIATDARGEFVQQPITSEPGNKSGTGAATGLLSGAIVGGVFGLLVGTGVLLIPGVGLLAAGPIAMALAGAGIGAVGGGLLGALIGLGIPQEHVATYAEAIRRGGCLVAIEVNDGNIGRAHEIMKSNHAVDIHQRAAYYQAEGFTQFDPKAPVYTQEQIDEERMRLQAFNQAAPVMTTQAAPAMTSTAPVVRTQEPISSDSIRARYDSYPKASGLTYEQWEPAYQYGWQLGQNSQFQSFGGSESTIRQLWEQSNPGTYDLYREAVYAGFDDAFARRSGAKLI